MNFDELLKSLHRDYLTSLPKKITLIREQAHAGSAADLRESFHKLKGTGRTYGMPEVSELAAVVEEVCMSHPRHAPHAADLAVVLLQDIYNARSRGESYDLVHAPGFAEIQKLLQN